MSLSLPSAYSRYIALFIDVMGQQDILSKPPDPLNPDCLGKSDTQNLFNESFGRIQSVSDNLKGMFECHSVVHGPGLTIETQFFSDCMLFYFPIEITTDIQVKERQLYSIFSLFVASAYSQIAFLSIETPLRGGIDLGLGALTPHAGLYGPVNYSVAHLEKKASYPRIAVGNNLIRYIKSEESYFPVLCGNLLNMCIPRDDSLMIDFMGPLIGDTLWESKAEMAPFSLEELLRKAFQFVRSERDRFKALANVTQNEKSVKYNHLTEPQRLHKKYSQLYDYFLLKSRPPYSES